MEHPPRAQGASLALFRERRATPLRLMQIFTAMLLIAASVLVLAPGATALLPTEAFEIDDGDIVDPQPAPPATTVDPYDWESLFETSNGVVVSTGVGDFETTTFIPDAVSSDDLPDPCRAGDKGDPTTMVSSGSDKNGDPIDTLEWNANSVPPKDDITNVYAAAKLVPRDAPSTLIDTIFYFAMERGDADGSSHVDFEFLRAPITLRVDGFENGTGCPYGTLVGTRTAGDVLVSMEFTNGGVLGTPEVRIWVGDALTGAYVLQPAAALPSGAVGFFTNDDPIDCGDWLCRTADGETTDTLAPRAFVEGYINLSLLLGTSSVGCYSTFIGKTRTSHEWNSEIKDFALGDFNTCDASISIGPSGVNPTNTQHDFIAHVESNASGTMQPVEGARVTGTLTGEGSWVPAADNTCDTDSSGNCTLTITSSEPGVSTVNASTTISVSGTSITRSTSTTSGPGGSGPATKNWVDDYIKVTPDDVNPIDQSHEFVVEYGVLSDGATGLTSPLPTITPSVSPSLTGYATPTACSTPVVISPMVWQCTFTINSSVGATYTATATGSTTVTMSGTPPPSPATANVSASTTTAAKGTGGNLGATKTYVNARILLGLNGLNEADNVNTETPEDPHAVTATVQVQDGSTTWIAAPNGTVVTFDVIGEGGFIGATNTTTCTTTSGTCTVQLNSSTVGTSTVSASASPLVHGITVARSTGTTLNTDQGGDANVVKKWADARISVSDDDTNEVTDEHPFTIMVVPDVPAGATVTNVSITPSVNPSTTVERTTCSADVDVNTSGTYVCEYVINSASAGVFDVDAVTVVDFAWGDFNLSITRSTAPGQYPGPGGDQGAAKTYVDARVAVGDDGVNQVGQEHDVTGHAEFHDGSPAGDAGWQDAVGETITFTITAGPGVFSNDERTITCQSGSDGTCTVTMVSDDPGVTWVSASTSYDVPSGGPTMFRSTATDGSQTADDLRKEWVSATITIAPNAVNEVGVPHPFTITVSATGPPAAITIGDVTYDVDPDPTEDDLVCDAVQTTATGKTRTCTLTISSDDADVFTANASVQVTMDGLEAPIDLTTNATNGSSGPAVKTYVDARLTITPDGVNEVGQSHPVTALVEVNDGTNGWQPLSGATVQLTEDGPGSIPATCGPTGSDGTCGVDLISSATGVSIVNGRVELTVLGEALVRQTNTAINSDAGGSGDLTKTWVDGLISITETAVNPVGAPHTFDIEARLVAPPGTGTPTFTITPSVSPAPDSLVTDCASSPTLEATDTGYKATCTVTINNNETGLFTANASVSISVAGVTMTRNTTPGDAVSAGPGGTGPATKRYVDANIQVGPDGVNEVGDDHVVTGHVNVDNGDGETNAPAGTVISFTMSGPGGLSAASCQTIAETGSCTVTLTSSEIGVTIVNASSTVTIDGLAITVGTNGVGPNSDGLAKRWIDGFITITPLTAENPLNEAHVFTVTVTAHPSGASPLTFDSITTAVTPSPGTISTTCGTPTVSDNTATCTITINSASGGTFVANATANVTAGGTTITRSTDASVAPAGPGGSGPATKVYVDAVVLGEVISRPATLPAATARPALPATGSDVTRVVQTALALLAIGAGLVLGTRQQRRRV